MCLVVLKIYIYIYLYQIIKAKAFPWFGPSVRLLGFRPSVLLVFVVSYVVISPKYPDDRIRHESFLSQSWYSWFPTS
jgi:hypothetical protein